MPRHLWRSATAHDVPDRGTDYYLHLSHGPPAKDEVIDHRRRRCFHKFRARGQIARASFGKPRCVETRAETTVYDYGHLFRRR
jgi:hypothetical protein